MRNEADNPIDKPTYIINKNSDLWHLVFICDHKYHSRSHRWPPGGDSSKPKRVQTVIQWCKKKKYRQLRPSSDNLASALPMSGLTSSMSPCGWRLLPGLRRPGRGRPSGLGGLPLLGQERLSRAWSSEILTQTVLPQSRRLHESNTTVSC